MHGPFAGRAHLSGLDERGDGAYHRRMSTPGLPRLTSIALPLVLTVGCLPFLGKTGPEAQWATAQGLPPVTEQTEERLWRGGAEAHLVHLVHEGGKSTYVLRLANGQIIGPLTKDPPVVVPNGKAPIVAVKPARPDAGYLLVDLKTGTSTPTHTSIVTQVAEWMVVLTAPEDWKERDALVLGTSGVVWHAHNVLPGGKVAFEWQGGAAALVPTQEGLVLFDKEGKIVSTLPATCPASFIRVGEEWRVALNCPEGTRVISKTGEPVWEGRDGLVFQETVASKAHHFVDPKGGHLLLPLDLQGQGNALPSAPELLGTRMWATRLARPAGAPEDYALLDPKTLVMGSPPVIVRPLTDQCRGAPERAMHLRAWCFGAYTDVLKTNVRGVFLDSGGKGPRWGLVDPKGKVLRGPVWADVRVIPIDLDSEGFANRYVRLTRGLFIVQDPQSKQWIRIQPNGEPEMDAAPHASPEEAAAQVLDELKAFHQAWSKDLKAAERDRRHRDMQKYAEWILDGKPNQFWARPLAGIMGADVDPRYDEDGILRRALQKIGKAQEPLTAHEYSNLRKAASVLETYYDGAPGPLSSTMATLHEKAVAKEEARKEALEQAELERIRKGIGWQEPSPERPYTPSYSPSSTIGGGWGAGFVEQQRDIQNREFQRWVDSVDTLLGK